MLQTLHIKNLALIENLTLHFAPGFTSLTGETGAGKSILLDALGLTLGNRADASLVRHGTAKADITAEYDLSQLPQVQRWLEENDLENDEPEQCLMRRTVTAEGRSKGYINGIAVPIAQLKVLSSQLIDIHGQHEHQSLMKPAQQLKSLDAYGQHTTDSVREAFQHWKKLDKTLAEKKSTLQDQQSRLDLLQFQCQEFEKIHPQPDEFQQLSEAHQSLSHAQEIQQGHQKAYQALEGDESQNALNALMQAIDALEEIQPFQPQVSSAIEQLKSALIDIQETANDIRHQAHTVELDPAELEEIENRLSQLHGLAKKYTVEPENLVEKWQQLQQDLSEIETADEAIEALGKETEHAYQTYQKLAKKLSQQRQKTAKALSQKVTESLHTLGMPNGHFEVKVDTAETPSADGIDQVQFWVTANKGLPLQPLTKVASGGELSRISLSIQVATAEVASLPTLIFDEVDVGIGGGIAEVVGQKMQQLGQTRQILSITHLPQVAAHGNQHLKIEKQTQDETTTTQVTMLETQQRIEELARMLGGIKLTEQTRKHAEEMLTHAQNAHSV